MTTAPVARALIVTAVAAAAAAIGACTPAAPVPGAAVETASVVAPGTGLVIADALPPGLHGTIAFQSDRAGRSKIFAVDLATAAVTALTSGRDHHDVEPTWSPDGRRLAFATTRFDGAAFHLAIGDREGGAVRRATAEIAFHRLPAWSPDARALFFSGDLDGTEAIYRIAADGAVPTRVSEGPWRAFQPAPAPDGRHLAYTVGDERGLHVVVHDLATGEVRRVVHGDTEAAWPAWAPDGRRLATTRLAGATSWIEVVRLDDAAPAAAFAIDGAVSLREAAWSPDGAFLVAAATRLTGADADWDLVVLQLAPPAAFRLTRGPGNDRHPAWTAR